MPVQQNVLKEFEYQLGNAARIISLSYTAYFRLSWYVGDGQKSKFDRKNSRILTNYVTGEGSSLYDVMCAFNKWSQSPKAIPPQTVINQISNSYNIQCDFSGNKKKIGNTLVSIIKENWNVIAPNFPEKTVTEPIKNLVFPRNETIAAHYSMIS